MEVTRTGLSGGSILSLGQAGQSWEDCDVPFSSEPGTGTLVGLLPSSSTVESQHTYGNGQGVVLGAQLP